MKKYLLAALMLSTLMMACKNNTASKEEEPEQNVQIQKEEAAWKEMMEVHDEVMPKMADINRISRSLKPYLEDNALADKSLQEEVKVAINRLEAADEGMMSWMAEIKQPSKLRTELEHDAVMAYIGKEKEAIAKVKEDMLSSLKNGNELLEKLVSNEE